jgi:hypothetical protein
MTKTSETLKKTTLKARKPAKPEPTKAEPAKDDKPAPRRDMGLGAYLKGAKVRG